VEALLDRPQIGCLTDEGGPVHLAQGREPVGPVATEVLEQAAVGVDAEELPDAFDGQDLAVGQGGCRATLAQALAGQPVVDQAEHRDGEGRNIHGETLVRCGDGVTSSLRGSLPLTQETRTPG
jgi:hypothetical protein